MTDNFNEINPILSVKNLTKRYETFTLKGVSFELEKGKITGFIGRNGAGKTTTLKSLFNLVHPDAGDVEIFNLPFSRNELEIKGRVGFVLGAANYYPNKKIKTITNAAKGFYKKWDDNAYRDYLAKFSLDENKTISKLSSGMKVKYALALALSHRAEILILDEPTSGLDPVSRDEILGLFLDLSEQGITILFSTHITSDLDYCADNIIYIKEGEIIAHDKLDNFVGGYQIHEFLKKDVPVDLLNKAIGHRRTKNGVSLLFRKDACSISGGKTVKVDLDAIMVHIEKENGQ
ncbi:MAG: ABC transporter ATP-binding protein [Bacilli bacterium]|jgi:ABC-2 type transport system ATP-binding protein